MNDSALIHARGLVKRFGDLVAVDAIDFDVAKGEAFGFLGPNGAGKSSTMRMIGCVSPVTSGILRILGRDPATDGPGIRARLGVVPQDDTLDLELTVRENLLIYGRYFDLPRSVDIRADAFSVCDTRMATRCSDFRNRSCRSTAIRMRANGTSSDPSDVDRLVDGNQVVR